MISHTTVVLEQIEVLSQCFIVPRYEEHEEMSQVKSIYIHNIAILHCFFSKKWKTL